MIRKPRHRLSSGRWRSATWQKTLRTLRLPLWSATPYSRKSRGSSALNCMKLKMPTLRSQVCSDESKILIMKLGSYRLKLSEKIASWRNRPGRLNNSNLSKNVWQFKWRKSLTRKSKLKSWERRISMHLNIHNRELKSRLKWSIKSAEMWAKFKIW